MTHEAISMDVSGNPELLSFAQEVKRSGRSRVLRTAGEELARVVPIAARSRARRTRRTSADDPIWDIIGMGRSGQPDNVSERIDDFLTAWEVTQTHP